MGCTNLEARVQILSRARDHFGTPSVGVNGRLLDAYGQAASVSVAYKEACSRATWRIGLFKTIIRPCLRGGPMLRLRMGLVFAGLLTAVANKLMRPIVLAPSLQEIGCGGTITGEGGNRPCHASDWAEGEGTPGGGWWVGVGMLACDEPAAMVAVH
eukprot:802470-Pelagomonas_calceolata.AAC.1